ncbi:MAG: PD-(D/E)XK nuclease domain-containing protein, partial [Prevotellaceae bacterium]|nr:PD-(D/E)XK nuclease domain-containing protein [Prevotellaceae bacterium]
QNTLYVVFKMMGFYTQVERATSQGRIDVVVQTKDYVYVMELKVDTPAGEALAQIDSKGYALPYSAEGRKVFKIGVNFSSDARRIAEWECKPE